MPQLRRGCSVHRAAERVAELSLLRQATADSGLACCAAENEYSFRYAGARDMFLSPREGI